MKERSGERKTKIENDKETTKKEDEEEEKEEIDCIIRVYVSIDIHDNESDFWHFVDKHPPLLLSPLSLLSLFSLL